MASTTNLLNRESARDVVLDPKDAERLLARVASAQGKVMVDAGYATYIASRSGVTNQRMCDIFGKSSSTITLYRRAGKYLVLGGEPNTDMWRVLTSKSKANFKPIGAAIDAEDATVESIETEVRKHFKMDGKPVTPVTRDGQPNGEGQPAQEEATALIKRLDVLARSLDAEQWATVETALNGLIARQVKRLAASAKTDSTAGAAA